MPHTPTAVTLAAIAAGGALGALARYGIAIGALVIVPGFAPAGTLIANVLGCGLIGVLMVLARTGDLSDWQRQLWVTGFLGALTTFSTFSWQTIELAREQRYLAAGGNLVANLLGSFIAVAVGMQLAQRWAGR